jgi:hypothetical protein
MVMQLLGVTITSSVAQRTAMTPVPFISEEVDAIDHHDGDDLVMQKAMAHPTQCYEI